MATDAALVWLLARQAALHMLPAANTDAATCASEIADRNAVQHAVAIGVDALRAFPMVLAHAVLFDPAPAAAAAAACSPARERVASFSRPLRLGLRDRISRRSGRVRWRHGPTTDLVVSLHQFKRVPHGSFEATRSK